jgi:thiamine kinase-like enzyme
MAPPTARFLRAEYDKAYSRLQAPFLPRLIAWDDDGEIPLLLLEDLSSADWPPPWTQAQVSGVLQTLAVVHDTALPGLDSVTTLEESLPRGWRLVAQEPLPFLSLALSSRAWLDKALPTLIEAAASARLEGDATLHLDVRSDNICFDGDRVVLVDWNWVSRGNREFDIAFWLPSLHAEGGPPPESILPNSPELAALVCGYFASSAGLPPIPEAPRVREVQLQQLRAALPWAVRALDLPPLDGP